MAAAQLAAKSLFIEQGQLRKMGPGPSAILLRPPLSLAPIATRGLAVFNLLLAGPIPVAFKNSQFKR